MTHTSLARRLACVATAATSAHAMAGAAPLVETFDRGAAGWTVRDLNCSNYAPLAGYAVVWQPTGGNPDGYIGRADPSSNCYSFEAPPAWLGDRSAFLGRTLRFSVRTTLNDYSEGSVVVLVGAGTTIVADFPQPGATWSCATVPLLASAFRVGSLNGPVVSAGQFAAVLADLDALRISAEFGSVVAETSDLDSVVFGGSACAADLSGDGTVDGADLGALLAAWGGDDPPADLNCDGSIDGADLGLLLGAWGPCPA